MGDAKNYIEIVIFLVGWIAVIASMKQNQKDMGSKVDGIGKDVKNIELSTAILSTKSQVHDEQISTLRSAITQQDKDNALGIDELKGEVSRQGRYVNKHEKWIAVVNNELKRAVPGWAPPTNGD